MAYYLFWNRKRSETSTFWGNHVQLCFNLRKMAFEHDPRILTLEMVVTEILNGTLI